MECNWFTIQDVYANVLSAAVTPMGGEICLQEMLFDLSYRRIFNSRESSVCVWRAKESPELDDLLFVCQHSTKILMLLSRLQGIYIVAALRPQMSPEKALLLLNRSRAAPDFFQQDRALNELNSTDLFVRFIPLNHIWNTHNLLFQIQEIQRLRRCEPRIGEKGESK